MIISVGRATVASIIRSLGFLPKGGACFLVVISNFLLEVRVTLFTQHHASNPYTDAC